jgi:hypothetical protein
MSSHQPESLGAAAVRPLRQPVQLNWGRLNALAVILLIIGVGGFITALLTGRNERVWEVWLVDFLYFTGIAQGGVVCSAAFYLTQGRWGGVAQYRLAEAFAWFLPLSLVLFLGVLFGRAFIFPWILHPIPRKAMWLNVPFLFTRDYIALLVMTALSMALVFLSRGPRAQAWVQQFSDIEMPPRAIRRLAPVLAILYCVSYTLLSFDLIMSLSPLWHSTLFGWWYFATDFWSAIVAMSLTAVILRELLGPNTSVSHPEILHDLGKMIFAFSIFWMYTAFAQYLVIWYGDIPSETFFLLVRLWHWPWLPLGWIAPILIWVVPFVVLLSVRAKRTPYILGTVAFLGLVGVWDLDYMLVVPSISPNVLPLGWVEACISLGFLGAFLLCAAPGLKLVVEAAVAAPTPPLTELGARME